MKSPIRSSDHLKDVLKIKVGNDKRGNPVLIKPEKKLTLILLGIMRKGEDKWIIKGI